jgi:hypothetical protein
VPYIEVPIEGTGEHGNHYRAKLRRGVPRSAVIPSLPNGKPRYTTALVWVDDQYDNELAKGLTRISASEGRALARQMDNRLDLGGLEQKVKHGSNIPSKR